MAAMQYSISKDDPMTDTPVNTEALRQVLQALSGPGHYIRELQATRSIASLTGSPSPIDVLIEDYKRSLAPVKPEPTITASPAERAVVPEGWPTNEMIEAGRQAANSHGPLLGGGQSLWHIFRDMLAAAPAAPEQAKPEQAAKPAQAAIDTHLDAVLRAAGSSLRHYTMQKSLDDMREAMRKAITGEPT